MLIGEFAEQENYTTRRRFQDKWGRSVTLNQRFKDKENLETWEKTQFFI